MSNPRGRPPRDEKERFLEKVRVMPSGCHEWTAAMHRDGYGRFQMRGKNTPSHRASFLLFKGDLPARASKLCILHHCDNRKCVNPDHLYLGTYKDNVRDAIVRNRWTYRVRIPPEQVAEARRLYADGGLSQQKIAEMFGVNQTTVSDWVRGKKRTLR